MNFKNEMYSISCKKIIKILCVCYVLISMLITKLIGENRPEQIKLECNKLLVHGCSSER